jgi:hypothetical protein
MSRTLIPVSRSPVVNQVKQITALTNPSVGMDADARGVFSMFPMMTPKYMRHRGERGADYADTMARMFILLPPNTYEAFLRSLPDARSSMVAKVLAGDGVKKGGRGYFDFLLQGANHSLNDKMQVVDLLADGYVAYFFGASPPIFSYTGTLINSYQDDWVTRMLSLYDTMGRGTALARSNLVIRLRYDSFIVTGSMTSFSWSLGAGQETACPFSFQLLVKHIQTIYGGMARPTRLPRDGHFYPAGVIPFSGSTTSVDTSIVAPDGSESMKSQMPPAEVGDEYYTGQPMEQPTTNGMQSVMVPETDLDINETAAAIDQDRRKRESDAAADQLQGEASDPSRVVSPRHRTVIDQQGLGVL